MHGTCPCALTHHSQSVAFAQEHAAEERERMAEVHERLKKEADAIAERRLVERLAQEAEAALQKNRLRADKLQKQAKVSLHHSHL
jgi:hypothetical protein